MLLLDAEIWSILVNMFKGIQINDQTLAMDVIRSVGPGGHYLGELHTREFMKNRWIPSLMDRRSYEVWELQKDGARQWAHNKAKQILSESSPYALDEFQNSELNKIILSVENSS